MKIKFSIRDILWVGIIMYGIVMIAYRLFAPKLLLHFQNSVFQFFRAKRFPHAIYFNRKAERR